MEALRAGMEQYLREMPDDEFSALLKTVRLHSPQPTQPAPKEA